MKLLRNLGAFIVGMRLIWTAFKISTALKSCVTDTLNQHHSLKKLKRMSAVLRSLTAAASLFFLNDFPRPSPTCNLQSSAWLWWSRIFLTYVQQESCVLACNPLRLGPQSDCIWTKCSVVVFFFKVFAVTDLWESGLVSILFDLFRNFLSSYLYEWKCFCSWFS